MGSPEGVRHHNSNVRVCTYVSLVGVETTFTDRNQEVYVAGAVVDFANNSEIAKLVSDLYTNGKAHKLHMSAMLPTCPMVDFRNLCSTTAM